MKDKIEIIIKDVKQYLIENNGIESDKEFLHYLNDLLETTFREQIKWCKSIGYDE